MKTLIFNKNELTDEVLHKVAKLLLDAKIVAFPTETVYGIGAHAFKEEAIEKIYFLKKRSKNKSLIVHIGKIKDVEKLACDIPDEFYLLAEKFFPGPLSIVLKKRKGLASNISSDSTVALRMPDSVYVTKLIEYVQDPIVGTSANISNEKIPTSATDVMKTFLNKIDAIIDAGECKIKVPSTIISLVDRPYKILREGIISRRKIDEALKSFK